MDVELNPCAHCGGEASLYEDTYSNDGYETDYWVFSIRCNDCWIGTASYETEQDAIDIWQLRVLEKPKE